VRRLTALHQEKGFIQTAILLFDQNGHPVVPTCASPCWRAQWRSRMAVRPPRSGSSLTVASTTAPSTQTDDQIAPDRISRPADVAVYVRIFAAANTASGSDDARVAEVHRIDKYKVIEEVTAAGFKFVGESPVLSNAADDHALNSSDPTVRGHTDQFLLKFKEA
jgi:hypothetical protein